MNGNASSDARHARSRAQPKRSFASRLFGYDIFISFALGPPPRGTLSYASDLARRLRERDFTVFFSEDEAPPGEHLDNTLRAALHRAKMLVVIANRATLQRPGWIRKEVEEFRRRHPDRPLIPISVGGALEDPAFAGDTQVWLAHRERIWLEETDHAVDIGIASDALVERLATAPARLRANVGWRWLARGVGASLLGLTVVAGVAAWRANLHAAEAERQHAAAVDNLARAVKGETLARANEGRAVREAERARQAEGDALAQKSRAEAEADRAVKAEGRARDERAVAVAQSRIALARQLAAQSALLRMRADRLPVATLLALESIALHPTFEGNQALRAALTLLPRREWSSKYDGAPERGRVRALAFSADGALLAASREDGAAELIDVPAQRTIALLAHDAAPGAVVELPGGGMRWKAPGVDAEVIALAFSADGKMLVTGSNDRTARVWDSANGRERLRLDHDGAVGSVAFHPRLPWLATGSADSGARIWNLADGALLRRIEGDGEVRAVAFSPDGRYLAALGTGGCSELLDLRERTSSRRWCLGSAGLGLAFSADGTRLAIAGGSHAGVHEVESGRLLFKVTHLSGVAGDGPEHGKWIDQVAFSPDGRSLASAGRDGTARVWDLANGQEMIRMPHAAPVQSVAFSPDGSQLVTASIDGTARLWDVASGRERLRAVHAGGSEVAAFSPLGGVVASGGLNGTVVLWRLASGDQVARIPHGAAVKAVAYDAGDGRFGTLDERGNLRIWTATGEARGHRGGFFGADRLVFGDDGRHVAVRARRPGVALVDLDRDMALVDLPGAAAASEVTLGPRYIAARDRERRRLMVWATAGGGRLPVPGDGDDPAAAGEDPWALAFDDTGRHLATLHQDRRGAGLIRVRALPTLKARGHVPFAGRADFALAPAGARLAMTVATRETRRASWRRHIEIHDVAGGRRPLQLAEDRAPAALRFAPDGGTLVTLGESDGDQARELRIWDTGSGRLIARLRHEHEVDAVRYAPAGEILASRAGGDIWIWDYRRGEALGRIPADAGFYDFRFSVDGRHLLTGGRDGAAVIWLWRTDDLRDEACRRLTRNLTAEEWTRYLGPERYRATCAQSPGNVEP